MDGHAFSLVTKAIAKQKRIDVSEISEDSSLESLGITSLDAITIMYEIEDALDIEVPNETLENLKTVQDILVEIDRLLQAGD